MDDPAQAARGKLTPREFLTVLAVVSVVNVVVGLRPPFRDWADQRPWLYFPAHIAVFVLAGLGVMLAWVAIRRRVPRA